MRVQIAHERGGARGDSLSASMTGDAIDRLNISATIDGIDNGLFPKGGGATQKRNAGNESLDAITGSMPSVVGGLATRVRRHKLHGYDR